MCLEVMLLDSTDLKHLYFFSVYFHQYCNHWIIVLSLYYLYHALICKNLSLRIFTVLEKEAIVTS